MLVIQLLEATSMDQVHRTRQQAQVDVDTAKHAMYQQRAVLLVSIQLPVIQHTLRVERHKVGVGRLVTIQQDVHRVTLAHILIHRTLQ